VQAGLDDVEVLVEYQLPLTSKRADVVLCGVHPRTRQPSYVVVELKQWSVASLLEDLPTSDLRPPQQLLQLDLPADEIVTADRRAVAEGVDGHALPSSAEVRGFLAHTAASPASHVRPARRRRSHSTSP